MIHFNRKILNNDKLFIAVSSGVDSIAICHFLRYKRPTIFHYNHCLRPQNDLMQESVVRFCENYKFDYIIASAKQYGVNEPGSSLEAEARIGRIKAIKALICGQIIFCHHLDDATESYFLNFLNGKPEHKPIPETTIFDNAQIIRPFLLTEKSHLVEYADRHDLMKFVVEDETNIDMSIKRNWVRHQMLPEIYKRNNIKTIVAKKFYQRDTNE